MKPVFPLLYFMKSVFWLGCGLSSFGPQHKFGKRKRRNVTHVYSMPYESGFSLTILFIYLLTCLFVLQVRKLNLKKFCCFRDLHVKKLCRVIQGEISKCIPVTLIILALCFIRLFKRSLKISLFSSPRENRSFPR